MTLQDTDISQILLRNSQISGVKLLSSDTNLSDIGHGLYIESIAKDRYIDLRLCQEKPFWGHTHPLNVQHSFSQLTNPAGNFNAINKRSFLRRIKDYQSYQVSEIISSHIKDKNIHLILDESILMYEKKDLIQKLMLISKNNDLIIEERDIILLNKETFFFSKDVKCIKYLNLSITEDYITATEIEEDEIGKDSALVGAMENFLSYLIFSENGKNVNDGQKIFEFFKDYPSIILKGRYIMIPKRIPIKILLKQGILISDNNFLNSHTIFAIPLSCTNDELSDTLARILKVVE